MAEFGQYRIEGLLGPGGTGAVHRAYDTRRDRWVALKLLPTSLSDDPEYQRRFHRESSVVAHLREPHVIPIHDFGEVEGRLFVDMRLVEGSDLGSVIAEGGAMAPGRAVDLISQAAEALDAAHAEGVVHRDVKPGNLLVTPTDFVHVVDFGVAHAVEHSRSRVTMTGAALGTLDYMAPERFESYPADPRTDVYSLACVLYECLTARKPFTGDDLPALMYAHLYSSPPRVGAVNRAAAALDGVVAKGMAKNPAERYPTTGALAAAARAALTTAGEQTEHVEYVEHFEEITQRVDAGGDEETTAARPLVAAPVAVGAGMGVGLMEHGGGRGPDVRHDDPGTAPTVGVALEPDRPQPVGPPPAGPNGPFPPFGPPGPVPAASPSNSRRTMTVLLAVVALLVAVAAGGAIWLLSRGTAPAPEAGPPAASPGVPTGNGPAIIESPVSPLARSIDTPTVGPTVQANATPGYMEIAPNGKFAYIANREAGVLSVFDTTRNTVTGTHQGARRRAAVRRVRAGRQDRLRQHLQQPAHGEPDGCARHGHQHVHQDGAGRRAALRPRRDARRQARVRAQPRLGLDLGDRHGHRRRGRHDQGGAQPALGGHLHRRQDPLCGQPRVEPRLGDRHGHRQGAEDHPGGAEPAQHPEAPAPSRCCSTSTTTAAPCR